MKYKIVAILDTPNGAVIGHDVRRDIDTPEGAMIQAMSIFNVMQTFKGRRRYCVMSNDKDLRGVPLIEG